MRRARAFRTFPLARAFVAAFVGARGRAARGRAMAPRDRWRRRRFTRVALALVLCVALASSGGASDAANASVEDIAALPAETNTSDGAPVRQIKFGERVAVDDLIGPVVINADCTTSYIENWGEMTTRERETTRRRLGARNRERHAECARRDRAGELR